MSYRALAGIGTSSRWSQVWKVPRWPNLSYRFVGWFWSGACDAGILSSASRTLSSDTPGQLPRNQPPTWWPIATSLDMTFRGWLHASGADARAFIAQGSENDTALFDPTSGKKMGLAACVG